MELKQLSHSLLILVAILYVAICHPHYPSDSWECCDVTVGYACFCEIPQEIEDYWGYYEQPNYNHLYYGDCKCNEISQLSVVLLTEDYAESIAIFDTNDEDNIHCFFEHIHQGEEIVCNAKGDDQVFADSTSFIIERSDRSLCEGRIDTTCAGDIIINEVDDRCAELVVVGYISDEGDVCDDGLSPCQCVGRYKRIIKPTNIDIHLDRDRDDRDSDKNNDDEDSDKIDDNQDIDSDDGDTDEVIVSPLFAQFLDNTRDTDSFGDDSISFSYSDSDSDSDSDSNSNSKSNSKSSSKSKSSKSKSSKSKSKSSSKSGSKSKSKSKSNSNSKSGENDGRFRILEPIFINDDNNNERSIENNENDGLFRTDPDEIDERIDDDLFFIDSDDSNDGLFIENESNESERSREEREREREEEDARAMASPLNMPSVNIIDENMTKTSIYVTMSYYVILLIILINTLTFSFYFCVRPLQKYCKENEFNMDYNGYYTKPSSKSSHSKDTIIRSSIDYIDTDDDISSLSDKTEEEE